MRGRTMWTRLQSRPLQFTLGSRLAAAVLSVLVAAATEDVVIVTAVLVAALASGGLSLKQERLPGRYRTWFVAELALVTSGVALTGAVASPLLAYALVLALAAGLTAGLVAATSAVVALAAALVVVRVGDPIEPLTLEYAGESAQWILLCALLGALGALSRRILRLGGRALDGDYFEAHRLLRSLRSVARVLPTTLDPVSQAEGLLERLARVCPHDRAAVFVHLPSGVLAPLVLRGPGASEWHLPLASPIVNEAWTTQHVQLSSGPLPRQSEGSPPTLARGMVIPLEVGLRSFGFVALEIGKESWTAEQVAAAERVASAAGLSLETALFFDEVRDLAVAEERHRLAREIHDGIAQELAQLGYALDEVGATASGSPAVEEAVLAVRRDISRIVGELRHSLFDLRSDIDPHGGLVAALADHVRKVGGQSGLMVHLTLDHEAARLPLETETQLLRIAQEAITNVRKHGRARNLWVTCQVSPPSAVLTVEDDGVGVTRDVSRTKGLGTAIMQERATAIRGRLEVVRRAGGGTVVRVRVGVQPNRKEHPRGLDSVAG